MRWASVRTAWRLLAGAPSLAAGSAAVQGCADREDALLAAFHHAGPLNGAVLVAQGDSVPYTRGFGDADQARYEHGMRIGRIGRIWRIASVYISAPRAGIVSGEEQIGTIRTIRSIRIPVRELPFDATANRCNA